MNILLVYPDTPDTFWSFSHVLPFLSKRAAFPPLGLLTVAAMLPADWRLKLIDLNVEDLSDDEIDRADYVLLSGMIVHAESARRVALRCAARGRTVIAGGPLFTTGSERFPEIHHFVLGEAEEIMPQLVSDLRAGTLRPVYQADRLPDVAITPVPRWDLIDFDDYVSMAVQFSRGCPFNCEFCDIIVMNGRIPRVKSPGQMIAELNALTAAGWSGSVFVVDDNFIGNKARVKEFLRELVAWRRTRGRQTSFLTEASLNVADDPELVDLMVRAGFKRVFIGIESPQAQSLAECAKAQNARRDMVASIRKLHGAGLEVMGGFIVGFDSDGPGIFAKQLKFIQNAGVVTAMVGLLTALPETRLFKRLSAEGRILGHSTGNNLDAVLNFIPRLDRDSLINGYRRLVQHLYAPRVYYQRILRFLSEYRPTGPRVRAQRGEIKAFFRSLWVLGVRTRGRREYWKFLAAVALKHRRSFVEAMGMAISGFHFRKIAASL